MLDQIVDFINNIVWSPILVGLLLFTGLYLSIRTRFVQVRRIGLMFRLLFFKKKNDSEVSGISSFQAFCVALSGRVGTGNIVGVATAIAMGGPGAVFWMWIVAFLGAATAFTESTLAQVYKYPYRKGWRGGPSSYIDKGLGLRWLGTLFAIVTLIGYGLLLVCVQSNGVSTAFENSFSIKPLYTGIGIVIILCIVIIGGIKRIALVASVVTPFMALAYLIMAGIIIAMNIEAVPGVFALIFKSAIGIDSALGGIVGSAIAFGVKRGLFSNEAGEGGGALVSGSADVDHPAKQGLVQAFSVYIDTILVCTATALMILCTGKYNIFDASGNVVLSNVPELGNNYVGFTQAAIDTTFNGFGSIFVSIALAFFAFTTIMAYYFYAESSITYLFLRKKGCNMAAENRVLRLYRILMYGMVIFGCLNSSGTVWKVGDIGVGLTTWINVIVLLLLCPKAIKALTEYESTINK